MRNASQGRTLPPLDPIEMPEVLELPPALGWAMWDAAVQKDECCCIDVCRGGEILDGRTSCGLRCRRAV